MMKKLIAVLIVCLLLLPGIALAEKGGNGQGMQPETGNGMGGSQGNGNGATVQQALTGDAGNETPDEQPSPLANETRERKNEEHKLQIEERQREHQQEQANRSLTANHFNPVRYAVHSLLAMENRTGGIGPQVSAIARNLSESANQTEWAEERIRSRNSFARFFFGGDAETADLLEQQANRTREQTRELSRLCENATCDNQTRTMLQEQIRIVEEEEQRLVELAVRERHDRGLFGWFRN